MPRPLPFVTRRCVRFQIDLVQAPALATAPEHCFQKDQVQHTCVNAVVESRASYHPLQLLCRPLGTLSFTLSHIELADPAHSFAVITCGPHWGLTPVVAHTDKPWFNWQVCHLTSHARPAMLVSCGSSKVGQLQSVFG